MGGKDRTGWAAASLQLLLGVPEDLVMADFLASNGYLRPMFQSFLDDFEARGGDPDLIAEFFWVRPEYLEAALDEMRTSYGTIERYFSDGLRLDDAGASGPSGGVPRRRLRGAGIETQRSGTGGARHAQGTITILMAPLLGSLKVASACSYWLSEKRCVTIS